MTKRRVNWTNCSILLLVIAAVVMIVSGCGTPKGFVHIGDNMYFNCNKVQVVDQGTLNGKPYWVATVEYVEINPKNDTIMERQTVWVANHNPYTEKFDDSYWYTEDITNVFGWTNTTQGFALFDAFQEMEKDYVSKQMKVK
jgi:lipoprotein